MKKQPPHDVLDVYLRGQLVGKLVSQDARLTFTYDQDYTQHPNNQKLSVSMPLQTTAFDHTVTAPYFSGLLPDEGVRRRLARYLGLSERNIFALLKEIGGECAGAVSVYPEGIAPSKNTTPTYRILEEDEADVILSSLDKRPFLAGEENIRISGAGAQDKLMIAFVNGKIAIPTGNTPSTHIIKPPIQGLDFSVHNEFFCMKLAKAIGLPVPTVSIFWLKDKSYYLVERYDRQCQKDGSIIRLHQEDFCQALHKPPEIKYENEGGASLEQCFALLDDRIRSGTMAGRNKITLLRGIIFNYLIGNGDAHAKNFSILYDGEAESLAPFYDLLCTVIYNNSHKAKMAMKLGGTYKFRDVFMRHWEGLGEQLGFRPDFVRRQVITLNNDIARAATLLHTTLMRDNTTASPIYEKIMRVIATHHQQTSTE